MVAALAAVLAVIGVSGNPMLLIYPMWIAVWIARAPLRRLAARVSPAAAFLVPGMVFGLLTESFAIWNNLKIPPAKRILISPDPALDLLYGSAFYLMLIGTWYLLLRKWSFSKRDVFVVTGLYGILTEELGQVFLRMFTVPVIGALYALIVASVYGIFPMLALIVSEERFAAERSRSRVRYAVAAAALFAEWALYGLAVLPLMKRLAE